MSSILQNLLSQRSFSLQRISPATCLQDVVDLKPQEKPVKGTLPLGLRCSTNPLFRCRIRGGRYYYSPSAEDAAAAALASLADADTADTATGCCSQQQDAAAPADETQGPDAFSVHELLDRVFLTGEFFAYVEDHCQLPRCSEEIQEAVVEVRDAQTKLYNLFGELSAETPAPSFAQAMAALDDGLKVTAERTVEKTADCTDSASPQATEDTPDVGVQARMVELQNENRELLTALAGLKSRLRGIAQEL